jgi:hypothetical protein
MINTFILCCHNTEYLKHASCYDHNDPNRKPWFEPGTLAITCNTYLQLATKHLLKSKHCTPTARNSGETEYCYTSITHIVASLMIPSITALPILMLRRKSTVASNITDSDYTIPSSGINKVMAQLASVDPTDHIPNWQANHTTSTNLVYCSTCRES